ncbi:MAG: hypothetical protein KatS3mg009_3319 [Acidimicrobiia bacterium]|nr:MAG: hypothetical protein KatS3mg009_3319 [Acidimicrobiia bacterium]
MTTLRTRWLGTVAYAEAADLQRALHSRSDDHYLLLLEHPHVYTLGSSAKPEHVLRDPASVGAELVEADRGGDVTYHGPGQLVGYPIVGLAEWRAGQRDVLAYVRRLESVLVAVLADFGVDARAVPGYTGVWVGDEKIAAIGVRVAQGRTRHGFALNVDPDLSMFSHIVPCGIRDRGVTSLARLLGSAPEMRAVVDRVVARFAECFGYGEVARADVAWRAPEVVASQPARLLGRLAEAGVQPVDLSRERPEWMRVRARFDDGYMEVKRLARGLELHTVCEEAGCPNIYECWADRTATFMILGERCTRACGFCLVDTRKPLPVDTDEPRASRRRWSGSASRTRSSPAWRVTTCRTGCVRVRGDRRRDPEPMPGTGVELLISDCKGDPSALATIFGARPDVLNHNLETVARLQRAVRPSAGYARSLAVLARAADAGLVTKSGIIVGMGETVDEVMEAVRDLRSVGVEILTVGQYLRPSASHLPVVRWWAPEEFGAVRDHALALGFRHVEAGPLVRSSYHARAAVEPVGLA